MTVTALDWAPLLFQYLLIVYSKLSHAECTNRIFSVIIASRNLEWISQILTAAKSRSSGGEAMH